MFVQIFVMLKIAELIYATSQVGEFGAQLRRTLARSKSVIASDHDGVIVGGSLLGKEVGRFVSQDACVAMGGLGGGLVVKECGICVGGFGNWCRKSGAVNRSGQTHL